MANTPMSTPCLGAAAKMPNNTRLEVVKVGSEMFLKRSSTNRIKDCETFWGFLPRFVTLLPGSKDVMM